MKSEFDPRIQSRLLRLALACFFALAVLCGCRSPKTIVVGSKAFTEGFLMSTLASMLLEEAGLPVSERFGVGSMIARQALLGGQIDLYPEYTGTAYNLYLGRKERVADPARLYRLVREADRKHGVEWLTRGRVNNTYALALRRPDAPRIGDDLSSLASYLERNPDSLRFGVDHEFYQRPDGFKRMTEHYGLSISEDRIVTMDIGLTFEAIKSGAIDVAMVYSTDGKLIQYDLHVLEDDRGFFPVYELCFNVRRDLLERRPRVRVLLDELIADLDTTTMQRLNYEVDGLGKPVRMVAEEYLSRRRASVPAGDEPLD